MPRNDAGFALQLLLCLAIFGAIVPPNAHAYIDGGTGAMLFQLIAGGLVASLFFIKQIWAKIKTALSSLGKKQSG